MLKALTRIASSFGARNAMPEQPVDDIDLTDLPVIVGETVYEAGQTDPQQLIMAVVDYVNTLVSNGRFNRREIPAMAMSVYHTDYYLKQINNGGHSQFIHNCGQKLPLTIADILYCLRDIEAEDYRKLLRLFNEWVQTNPDAVSMQTGFDGGRAPQLEKFDETLYGLESKGSLRDMMAEWISSSPNLLVLPDEQVGNACERLCDANPYRAVRGQILRVADLQVQLTGKMIAAIGLAAGVATPLAPITLVGDGAYRDVAGKQLMCFSLFTTEGKRVAVLTDDEVIIHDGIRQDDANKQPDPLDATTGQVSDALTPEIGEELSRASFADAEAAAEIATRTHAAAAIDLLLSHLLQPPRVDHVTIRSAGMGGNGEEGMTLSLVLDDASLVMTAIVGESGASLLSEPDHNTMVEVTRAQIDAHAEEYALENLLA